jgi:cholesterol oxidase
MSEPATVRFTEEMKGALGFGAADHRGGWEQGKASGTDFMFHLTISVPDLDAFAADPDHPAPAVGWVRCGALSDADMPVERGTFNLFAPGFGDGRLTMRYRLWFRDAAGAPLTLTGYKDVGDDLGFDVWKDTTSLAVDLLDGHVEESPRAPDGRPQPNDPALVRARGVLVILPLDFARQLTTFRGTVFGVVRFGGMFVGALWRTYRGRARRERGDR